MCKFISEMKRATLISLILILATVPSKLSGQQVSVVGSGSQIQSYYYFNHFETANGLPSNTVFCTVQDKDGFLWVGTRDGICRFDGANFVRMGDMSERIGMSGVTEVLFVDSDGLLWFSTAFGRGYYNPFTGETTNISLDVRTQVNGICQDGQGDIWFCADDLFRYSKSTSELVKYPSDGMRFLSIAADEGGRVWCTCSDGRFLRYDRIVDKFKEEQPTGLMRIVPVSGNRILATTADNTVILLNPNNGESETIFDCPDRRGINCMVERVPGEFWIGTTTGIQIYTEGVGMEKPIVHSDSEKMSISSNYVTHLSTDNEGNVWASTIYNGLNLWRNSHSAFYFFYPIEKTGSIAGKIARAIAAEGDILWVGTEDGYLNSLSRGDTTFQQYDIPGERNNYQDILPIGNELLIATYDNGIFRFDPQKQKVVKHYEFPGKHFFRQLLTTSGDILVGTDSGVMKYVPQTDTYEKVPDTSDAIVMALCQDSNGTIWVGTTGHGIILLDSALNRTGDIGHWRRVTSFFEDSRHRMWNTTEGGGLNITDIETFASTHLTMDDGLSSNITCAVTEDEDGTIWVSTTNGLCIIDPDDFHATSSYFHGTPIEANVYTYGAVCKFGTDAIFLGTTDGMLSFFPSQIKFHRHNDEVFISSITGINGSKSTELSSPGHSAAYSKRIVTSYKDVSSLGINFSCPDYSSVLSSHFQYTLSSRKRQFSAVTDNHYAILSNIAYGKNVFTVSLVGSDSPKSTKAVEIIVRPPFAQSFFAKALILLAFLLAVGWIGYFIVRQRREKRRRQIEDLEKEKQKEMYESKNSFFTNITHEIRTPLTLIKMPLDKMIKSGEYSKKDLLAIQTNTDRLLNLTNQLLDIRKLEQKEEKLEFTRQNICDIVRKTCSRFSNVAEDQGVNLDVSVSDSVIYAMCARDSVEKIVSNLISNALKYGKDTISVNLTAADGQAQLRVDSNGEQISASDRDRIFEKFFHGGKGTGLGLPLARALAEQHGGCLYLDSSRTDVNSFVLELPLEHPESITVNPSSSETVAELEQSYDDSHKDVLIVEDNQDFRLYLAEALSTGFNVFTAANGRAAVKKLSERKIDLIISDIMMPVMDGCELCNYVKSTMEYSHIPVILLTAAVGMETRIETLEVGADGYIEKPFPIELLEANIANLFKNRDIAYRQFSNSPLSQSTGVATNKMDEDFMSRLHAIVLEKMSENDLGIDDLSSALNISNSTLFRKVKANTGMNIIEYIRLCRLKRAAELLASRQYRINEVADMVGFSSSSYFAANFQKQFNVSPSAFVKGLESKKE